MKKIGHENFSQNLNLTEIFALKIFDVKVVQHNEHWFKTDSPSTFRI